MFDDATLIFVPVIPLSLFFYSFFPSNYWLISSTHIFAGVRTVLYALGYVHTKTLNTTLVPLSPKASTIIVNQTSLLWCLDFNLFKYLREASFETIPTQNETPSSKTTDSDNTVVYSCRFHQLSKWLSIVLIRTCQQDVVEKCLWLREQCTEMIIQQAIKEFLYS